ncbi:nucleoside triphosphate pyrophosphohydrolase [Salipaludibacillus sp. LMS25]|jgi:predicted house-cleaning noncanonical NTP pyrophosphatase (MazG superfamily)|uniref:nucleoside triphosphate pyrophosphohydrolase n=1 Tax=Salipaludibacillus sp. LMS25 TaxID=2924031 RepID=UPI0020D0A862|nr:nucleoside triphosphate pyrophosphohydrolase [Salipaludibacillus sp. LMS25]UTR13941.1 nucleoside triphosphate pyrophosphohydrolase [Salipaludibacillus sp. LMS25]
MPSYHKLVRDKIPEIIKMNGQKLTYRRISGEDFIKEAKETLKEEMKEYLEAQNAEQAIEELADLLEIIYCLAERHGYSKAELESIRSDKSERRGAFHEGWFLETVGDDDY